MMNKNDYSFNTKEELKKIVEEMFKSIEPHFSAGRAYVFLNKKTATIYDDKTLGLEMFSRILWGIAPLIHDNDDDIAKKFKEGILNGTDPSHREYWGKLDKRNYNQKMVEMVPIGFFLLYSKESFWDKLNNSQRCNITNWLNQINENRVSRSNWLFFRILINTFLYKLGTKYNDKLLKLDIKRVEEFYLGDGWYSDGKSNRRDYYVSFAIQFYSLLYVKFMKDEDSVNTNIYIERAKQFAKDFIYWFSEEGSAIPFGRSLTYRFAQVAFWSALLVADVEVFSIEIIKGIIVRNLEWWFSQDIFDNDGTLSIGYSYGNLIMSEDYNGYGSPYWALKTFILLTLDDNHKFWTAQTKKLPELENRRFQKYARMTICRHNNHVVAFVNGQNCNIRGPFIDKYEKIAYSNIAGFSVSRSNYDRISNSHDSTISLSFDNELFLPKTNIIKFENSIDLQYSKWGYWSDIEVETYILPGLPWHVRIHKIKTKRKIYLQESGFSIEKGSHNSPSKTMNIQTDKNGLLINCKGFSTGIYCLFGNGTPELINPPPNSNILYSRTQTPVLRWELEKGEYIIGCAVYCEKNMLTDFSNWTNPPIVEIEDGFIKVVGSDLDYTIDTSQEFKFPKTTNYRLNKTKKTLLNMKVILKQHLGKL